MFSAEENVKWHIDHLILPKENMISNILANHWKPTQYNILTIYNNSLSLEFHTQVSDGIDIGEYRLS